MILLQTAVSPLIQFGPMLLIMVVFYFFFIRPQMKKQREQENFVKEKLVKGKEVVTNSGIIGRILNIDGNAVTLVVDGKNTIRVLKGFISRELTEAIQKSTPAEVATTENAEG
ncbi:MAG: preprotein translocase subunit YajC [Saprospiraceae bacterium]|nr:preprotein translocase subunit YajC [Saprospiraceae bacterium]MBP7679670.1 preprotein translocase subunit YajC [Saprospiraceae bacterium]